MCEMLFVVFVQVMGAIKLELFLAYFFALICLSSSFTNSKDVTVLQSLKESWQNLPPKWYKSKDPCEGGWEGVVCRNFRVTELSLSSVGIKGKVGGDIGGLDELISLDLSANPGLVGPLSSRLGDLKNLHTLMLQSCHFNGKIPDELGNLVELKFLALNSNDLTGTIPPSLGKLSKLYWLDLAENQLSGPIPVSTETEPGLDQLLQAKHFHFGKNRFSGTIPEKLFSSQSALIHILLDGNELSGPIPSTLGLIPGLEVLRLDRNGLSGEVPPNLNSLKDIIELNLAHNQFSGPFPDLTGMFKLLYLDLSNNSFDPIEPPTWFSEVPSLTTMVIEHGPLTGVLPKILFSFPQLQQLKLKNNHINDTLDMGTSISSSLQLVDLENNQIESRVVSEYKNKLILRGNPICETGSSSNSEVCGVQTSRQPYSTSLLSCGTLTCSEEYKLNPMSCACQRPFEGTLQFRGPFFRELSNATLFGELERSLWTNLGLNPGSVMLQNLHFNADDYLLIHLGLFPSTGDAFNSSEIIRIGFALNFQNYKPPKIFGPFVFFPTPYGSHADHHGIKLSVVAILAVSISCFVFVVVIFGLTMYAVRQKNRADAAVSLNHPFASWETSGEDRSSAPRLKGAKGFSYEELKNSTGNFSDTNELGQGGYGKVYKGTLADGRVVAIKRAHQGSMQGANEFKTEIELLSRVHHRNVVSLFGFCYEQGEQMLVYEFLNNGTLLDHLSGKSKIHLDWKTRLRIALGAARGLSYLHELADPPIIHRDVKSNNILLDETLTAKVADFGVSKLASSKGHVTTDVKGTMGYLDPEYYLTRQLTDKSDVYSFGVVMLELVTARQPIDNGKYIVREVRQVMNRNDDEHYGMMEMMDPSIRNRPGLIGFGRFLELAMQCVNESGAARPTMGELVRELEAIFQNDGITTHPPSAPTSSTQFLPMNGRDLYDDDNLT